MGEEAGKERQVVRPNPIFPLDYLQAPRRVWCDWSEPWSWYVTGDVNTWKGGTVFSVVTNVVAAGGFAVDTFGSDNDSETLTWFKSPYKDRAAVIVSDSWKGTCPFNWFRVSEFSIPKAKEYDVVTTDKVFFRNEVDHYASLGRIFEVCRNRRGYKQEPGKPIMALAIREARKVIRSQITANMTKDEQEAQWVFVDLNAQRAHSGVSPIVDSQRWMDVHVTYRDLASYKILKGFGPQVAPSELDWIWSPKFKRRWWRSPYRTRQLWETFLRTMPGDMFVSLDRQNGVSFGVMGRIDWLRYKGYDLAQMLGIQPDFEKQADQPRQKELTPKAREMLQVHKRIRELEGKGLVAPDIGVQMEMESGKKMSAAGIRYHMSFGDCSCETKTKGGEESER